MMRIVILIIHVTNPMFVIVVIIITIIITITITITIIETIIIVIVTIIILFPDSIPAFIVILTLKEKRGGEL
jgi:hypothetical protein